MTIFAPHPSRALGATALAATLALVGAACGSSGKSSSKLATATLNGSGSTFQLAYDQAVIKQFTSANSGITISYGGGGSGKGLTDLLGKLVDFAGTDAPIKAADLSKYTGGVLYFPIVAAPITVSYNVSGVTHLTLGPSTIAGIFSGKITNWNDPAIAADNTGATLPNKPIVPVHRSDASGTTNNFTLYLTKAAPSDWTLGSGKTVNWPGGQAGNGNNGVAQQVKSTDGAVGYVDYSDARAAGLTFATIKNSSGKAIAPSLAAASAALAGAAIKPDLTYDPTNASGADAYPITSPTWMVVYRTQTDKAKGQALKAFLSFILSDGQKSLATDNDFAPLSSDLVQKATSQLSQLVIPA